MTVDDGIVFIDLDGCRDKETSAIAQWGQEIIDEINSYTELSPSGCGVHIFAYGAVPENKGRKRGGVEMYATGRYATMTGQHVPGTPKTIEHREDELAALHLRVFGAQEPERPHIPQGGTGNLSDEDIVRIAGRAANSAKFKRLWSGNTSGYASRSEADMALLDILAFYTSDNGQLDRLMYQSGSERWEGLPRGTRKHDIEKAVRGTGARFGDNRRNRQGTKEGQPPPSAELDSRIDILKDAPLSDTGNAECLEHLFGGDFRFDHTRRKWLVWAGAHWQVDEDGRVERAAIEVIRERKIAALSLVDTERQRKMISYLIGAENASKQRGLLTQASVLRSFATTIARFDIEHGVAGAPNGLLDLNAGLLYEPSKDDLITMCLGTPVNLEASCSRWRRFLNEVFADDQELIAFIQRAIGYSLTGDTSEQVMFLCHGSGANGKSVFLETLGLVLGDYSAGTPFATFDADRRNESTNDLAALKGKRFVTVIESDEDRRLAEARVKAVTGQDRITCRFLYGEFFTYEPTFKLWMAMNHKPIIRGTDRGIWRRIKLIPFTQNFEGRAEDKNLKSELKGELSGILNWILEGLQAWQKNGLGSAKVVEAATEEYRKESDILGQWFSDCAASSPGSFTTASEAFDSFRNWCKSFGFKEPTQTGFARSLVEHGYERGTERNKRGYKGFILVVPDVDLGKTS
jgi:putative DNA primase/helicase